MFASSTLPELQTTLAPSAVTGARLAPVTAGPAYVTTGQVSAAEDVESIAILSQMLQNEAQRHQRERSVVPSQQQQQQQHGGESADGGDMKQVSEASAVANTCAVSTSGVSVSVANDVLSELIVSGGAGSGAGAGTGAGNGLREQHIQPLVHHTAIYLEPSAVAAAAAAATAQRLSIDQLITIPPGFGGGGTTITPHFLAAPRPASPIVSAMTAVAASSGGSGTTGTPVGSTLAVAAHQQQHHQEQQVQLSGHHPNHPNHHHHTHHHHPIATAAASVLSHHHNHQHQHGVHQPIHAQSQQTIQRGSVSSTPSSLAASIAVVSSASPSLLSASLIGNTSVPSHPPSSGSHLLRLAAIDADVLTVAKGGATSVRGNHTPSSSSSSSITTPTVAPAASTGLALTSDSAAIAAGSALESTSLWLTASTVNGTAAAGVIGEVKREPLAIAGGNTEEAAHGLLALHKQHCDRLTSSAVAGANSAVVVSTAGDADRHIPLDGDEFKCDICDVRLKRKAHMARHRRTHTNERPHVCTVCYKGFIRREHLLRHLKIHEPGYVPSRPTPASTDHRVRPYQCVYCGRGFLRRYHLQRHITTQGTCPALAAAAVAAAAGGTNSPAAVAATPLADPANSPPVRHPCDLCGSTFLRREHMKRHRKTHTGKKEHACYLCGKAFFRREHVRKHVLSHNRGPRGSSSGGGSAALSSASSAATVTVEQQQQLFDVTMAAAVAAANSVENQRNTLLGTHTGVTLEGVTIGNTGIVTSVAANAGTQSIAVGPGRGLVQNNPSNRRSSNANQPKNHVCAECGRRFGRKEHLQRHEATHSSTRPFSCGVCGRGFNRKEHLRKHLQNTACASTTANNNSNNSNTASNTTTALVNNNSGSVSAASSAPSSSTLVKREQPELIHQQQQQQQLVMLTSGGCGTAASLLHHTPHGASTVHHHHPHHPQHQHHQPHQFQLQLSGGIHAAIGGFLSQPQQVTGELVLDMSTGSGVSDVAASDGGGGGEEAAPSSNTVRVPGTDGNGGNADSTELHRPMEMLK